MIVMHIINLLYRQEQISLVYGAFVSLFCSSEGNNYQHFFIWRNLMDFYLQKHQYLLLTLPLAKQLLVSSFYKFINFSLKRSKLRHFCIAIILLFADLKILWIFCPITQGFYLQNIQLQKDINSK